VQVAAVERSREVAELGARVAVDEAGADHRQARQGGVGLDAPVQLPGVGARLRDPVGVAAQIRLVQAAERHHRAAQPALDHREAVGDRCGAAVEGVDRERRLDARLREPLDPLELILAGGAEAVEHVAHAQLAQPGEDALEVPVGRGHVGQPHVHPHRVAEGARRLRLAGGQGGVGIGARIRQLAGLAAGEDGHGDHERHDEAGQSKYPNYVAARVEKLEDGRRT
jgi:hypothetical protein